MINFVNLNNNTFIYFLGRYWADGWSKTNAISCKNEDMKHLKNWIKSFGFKIKTKQAYKNGKPWGKLQAVVHFSHSDFSRGFLRDNGFTEKSTGAPNTILSKIPSSKHYLFWRGYFDGDGHVQIPNKKRPKKEVAFWGSIDQDWSELKSLLDKLNIKHTKITYKRKSGKSSCIAFYKYNDIIKFSDYIYDGFQHQPIGMERKWKSFQALKQIGTHRKTSTSPGVCFNKGNNKWKSDLLKSETGINPVFLGWYDTEKDAIEARRIALSERNYSSSPL